MPASPPETLSFSSGHVASVQQDAFLPKNDLAIASCFATFLQGIQGDQERAFVVVAVMLRTSESNYHEMPSISLFD